MIKNYIKRPPITIGRDATVEEAAALMAEKGVGSLAIVDEGGRPVGIITERDVVKAVARRALGARVVEVGTTSNLLTASPEDDEYEVLKKMRERRVRHLLVVDKEGKLVGVLSIRDFLEDAALKALGDKVWWPPPEE
ncbi:CBS domain-containing protein [Pyrobaculum calidifontis]|uniref:Signal transduction protein with CBS domains n=1 Tax=Pyrobaculum calidifontis (strain DSM 21063 / JCM 11548 / VA1) TaxID=410359 RepID=A3MVZ6_PYRCJ|nr:CBS domain-containing protein [Pyrobaculum calidifontis]ABO08813.1 putative signal transduction protein with CBS domains [Pyrobaculum calidifontis JCM 11548]